MAMLQLYSVSPQHLYQNMKKHVVIVLMNISLSKLSDKIIHNIIL